MAKTKSNPSSASDGASAAPGAASLPGQGAQGAAFQPVVPGAATSAKTVGNPSRAIAPREAERGTPPPVQNEVDSEAGVLAWALAQAGVEDMDLPEQPATPPSRQKKAAVTSEDDDDEDDREDLRSEVDEDENQDDADDAAAFDEDAPILGEDSEDEAGDKEDLEGEAEGDEPDASKQTSKLKKDNFKLREERRALRDELSAKDKELDDLRAKVVQATAASSETGLPQFGGYFQGIKSSEEVDHVVNRIENDLDFLEDNLDGYEFEDAKGNTITVSAEQAKAYRRMARESLRQAGQVKAALENHSKRASESETLARKKYPFVFDSQHTRNALVLDLAKEHPALSRDPARALALGRMAVGKLVESGEFVLVKRAKPKADHGEKREPHLPERRATSSPSASPSGAPARRPSSSAAAASSNLHDRILNGDPDALVAAAAALLED